MNLVDKLKKLQINSNVTLQDGAQYVRIYDFTDPKILNWNTARSDTQILERVDVIEKLRELLAFIISKSMNVQIEITPQFSLQLEERLIAELAFLPPAYGLRNIHLHTDHEGEIVTRQNHNQHIVTLVRGRTPNKHQSLMWQSPFFMNTKLKRARYHLMQLIKRVYPVDLIPMHEFRPMNNATTKRLNSEFYAPATRSMTRAVKRSREPIRAFDTLPKSINEAGEWVFQRAKTGMVTVEQIFTETDGAFLIGTTLKVCDMKVLPMKAQAELSNQMVAPSYDYARLLAMKAGYELVRFIYYSSDAFADTKSFTTVSGQFGSFIAYSFGKQVEVKTGMPSKTMTIHTENDGTISSINSSSTGWLRKIILTGRVEFTFMPESGYAAFLSKPVVYSTADKKTSWRLHEKRIQLLSLDMGTNKPVLVAALGKVGEVLSSALSARNMNFYSQNGVIEEVQLQGTSRISIAITSNGNLIQNGDVKSQLSVMQGVQWRDSPGSFSVESESIISIPNGHLFEDSNVSITAYYTHLLKGNDDHSWLKLPKNTPIALVRWASVLPSPEGTPTPSISTHSDSTWSWHRPYRLVIIPEAGTKILPLNKHIQRNHFKEIVLLPGLMKLIRKLPNPTQMNIESYLVSFTTPFALGYGIRSGNPGKVFVIMAASDETLESCFAEQQLELIDRIPP
ncbi:hypothetical protein T492DRAFT_844643 [Pavlovales sp. CCMP2436]|nr:hypothetical protein T492DRAFT_844643 [Pavlovales sp. CCMP2436]